MTAYAKPSIPEQVAPECLTDMPIVVPTLPIDATFPCCSGCETLNEPMTKLVPIEEDHLVMLPRNNQGCGTRMAMVHSSQCAHHGGCQGVTPSNSKGGLPAPEAKARTQEGSVKAELTQPLAGRKARKTKQRPGIQVDSVLSQSRKERDQETSLRRKQRAGATPSH